MGTQRKHVNDLCNNRRTVTAATGPRRSPFCSELADHYVYAIAL
jgi:hypothetical protein